MHVCVCRCAKVSHLLRGARRRSRRTQSRALKPCSSTAHHQSAPHDFRGTWLHAAEPPSAQHRTQSYTPPSSSLRSSGFSTKKKGILETCELPLLVTFVGVRSGCNTLPGGLLTSQQEAEYSFSGGVLLQKI